MQCGLRSERSVMPRITRPFQHDVLGGYLVVKVAARSHAVPDDLCDATEVNVSRITAAQATYDAAPKR